MAPTGVSNAWSLALMEKHPGVLPVTQSVSLPQHVVGLCSGCASPNLAQLLTRSGALMEVSIFLMEASGLQSGLGREGEDAFLQESGRQK